MFDNTQLDREFCANIARIADALDSKGKQGLNIKLKEGYPESDKVVYYLILEALADGIELQQQVINNEYINGDEEDHARQVIKNNRLLYDNLKLIE